MKTSFMNNRENYSTFFLFFFLSFFNFFLEAILKLPMFLTGSMNLFLLEVTSQNRNAVPAQDRNKSGNHALCSCLLWSKALLNFFFLVWKKKCKLKTIVFKPKEKFAIYEYVNHFRENCHNIILKIDNKI